MNRFVHTALLTLLCGYAAGAAAEIFIYRGPDGERMVSDRPLSPHDGDYELLTRRDTLASAGRILANKPLETGGPKTFRSYIRAASERYDVDPALVEAVIVVESGFNPEAVSTKGATGLMQLTWSTAQHYHVSDRFDPRANIDGGVRHLAELIEKFDGNLSLALAAYNAGAGAVTRYRGVPPYPETRRYIAKVLSQHATLKPFYAAR